MNRSPKLPAPMRVAACEMAVPADGHDYRSASPTTIYYADPAAWAVVAATGKAIAALAEGGDDPNRSQIGIITVSESGPSATIREVAAAAKKGRVSPVRFSAAIPSSLLGLACIIHGLRGPSLNLTMAIEAGVPIALALAAQWLAHGAAEHVLIVTYHAATADHAVAKSVFMAPGIQRGDAKDAAAIDTAWGDAVRFLCQ